MSRQDAPSTGPSTESVPTILCKVCEQGELERTSQYRLGNGLGVIGTIIAVLATVAIALAAIFAAVGAAMSDGSSHGRGTFEFGVAAAMLGSSGISSLIIGLLLAVRRTVLRCPTCGAIIEAS